MWLAGLPTTSVLKHLEMSKTDQKEGSREHGSTFSDYTSSRKALVQSLLVEAMQTPLWTKGREWVDLQWRLCTPHSGQKGEQTQGSHVYTASREDEIIRNCNIERRMFRHL